jgi:hypothetical protein
MPIESTLIRLRFKVTSSPTHSDLDSDDTGFRSFNFFMFFLRSIVVTDHLSWLFDVLHLNSAKTLSRRT